MDQLHHNRMYDFLQSEILEIKNSLARDAKHEYELPMVSKSEILGLKLTITQELVDQCTKHISQTWNQATTSVESKQKEQKVHGHGGDSTPQATFAREKQKACSFNARQIRIGSWQFTTMREGDFMAKIYFSKRKLVWEFLRGELEYGKLKYKMDIPWSDIILIRSSFGEQEDSLFIKLSQAPVFSSETNPQPRKHTNWEPSEDFTNNQATVNRIHHVIFPPGSLRDPYERLMQSDERLSKLDKQPFQLDLWFPFPDLDENCIQGQDSGCFNSTGEWWSQLGNVPDFYGLQSAAVPNHLMEYPNEAYESSQPKCLAYDETRDNEPQMQNSILNQRAELNTYWTTLDQSNMQLSCIETSFPENAQIDEQQAYMNMMYQGNDVATQDYQAHAEFNSNLMQLSQNQLPPQGQAELNVIDPNINGMNYAEMEYQMINKDMLMEANMVQTSLFFDSFHGAPPQELHQSFTMGRRVSLPQPAVAPLQSYPSVASDFVSPVTAFAASDVVSPVTASVASDVVSPVTASDPLSIL